MLSGVPGLGSLEIGQAGMTFVFSAAPLLGCPPVMRVPPTLYPMSLGRHRKEAQVPHAHQALCPVYNRKVDQQWPL